MEVLESKLSKTVQAGTLFEKNLDAFGKYRFIVNQGGARSSKTYSILQTLIYLCLTQKLFISVVSISYPHLRRGAIRDWKNIMEDWGVYEPSRHSLTDSLYSFPSGGYIEFFSADNSLKTRGPGRDILFLNEVNLFSKDTFDQLNIRTRRMVFMDYNPADEFHWIYDQIIPLKETLFIQSTYLDNPFLPKEQVQEIERMKNDPDFWKVYGLGERGTHSDTIYSGFELYETVPDLDYHFGLDFGFTHPNALVKVTEDEDRIYFEQCLYEPGLTAIELAQRIAPIVGQKYVYCDSARPEVIEELCRAGINAYGADKSVKEGIDFIRSHRIFVHRESVDLQKEMRSYKWKKKPNGQSLDEPVKAFDDLLDAARYGAMGFKNQFSGSFAWGQWTDNDERL